MTSIQPELWVDRAAQAVAFYQAAFGATDGTGVKAEPGGACGGDPEWGVADG